MLPHHLQRPRDQGQERYRACHPYPKTHAWLLTRMPHPGLLIKSTSNLSSTDRIRLTIRSKLRKHEQKDKRGLIKRPSACVLTKKRCNRKLAARSTPSEMSGTKKTARL